MSVLTTQNIGLSFGAFDVFGGVSVRIADDSKIGLIGPNGIGKTSLLLILADLCQATTGSVHVARGRRLGYLRQESIEAFASVRRDGDRLRSPQSSAGQVARDGSNHGIWRVH
jgi:ATP-binding cassette subfamily F protein 3